MDCAEHKNADLPHCGQCLALYWQSKYNAERQRARLPEGLVERLREHKDGAGDEQDTFSLVCDILAWHEGGE